MMKKMIGSCFLVKQIENWLYNTILNESRSNHAARILWQHSENVNYNNMSTEYFT